MVVEWNFLALLFTTLVTPLMEQLQGMLGGVCATMQPIALVMVTLWLGLVGMDIANGTKSVQAAMKDFFIAAMVVGALQVGQYTEYVSDFFLQAVPNTISAAMGGAGSPVAGLDRVLNSAMTAGAKAYEALPVMSLKSIPLGIGILIFLVVALVSVGWGFSVFAISAIINISVVAVGPVFLALAAIPQTRRFASGWLQVLVAGCTTQVMCLAVMLILTGAEGDMLQRTVATTGAAGATVLNSINMLWGLAKCGLLMALSTAVVRKIPSIAQAISGGVHAGSQGAHAVTLGAASNVGSVAMTAARGVAGAVGRAASAGARGAAGAAGRSAVRPTKPTGPSLS